MPVTKEDILRKIRDNGVKYIRLWFTDILGQLKGMTITLSEIENVLDSGQGFDGSSIEGFVRIEESDLMAWPDLDTFRVFPWDLGGEKVAMMFCDIENPDGTPYDGDPRYCLRRILKRAADMGLTFYVGPELEYFYFKDCDNPETMDTGGYFDYSTVDVGVRLRKKTVNFLEQIGVPVECSHHEVANSQHEIDLQYQDALKMADFVQIYRLIVKEVAEHGGYYATFMPKPLYGQNGNGMHVHQSLFRGDKNIFFAPGNEYNLSDEAKHYVAGLLKHVKEFTLVTNQWVNSYKRLVPGYEAPCYISWGRRNRSSLVRVPAYRGGKEKAVRIELRSPDPACNPYLSFAVMLAAGLKGMEDKLELVPPIEKNIFHMSQTEIEDKEIEILPHSLDSAIAEAENSELLQETLGDHMFSSLLANKKIEWESYRVHVHRYELDKYLPLL
jgi:glutamine synthetase